MSLFASDSDTDRYGVLIDIGSGSVLTAVVKSSAGQNRPQIIWSHREHAPLRNVDSLEQSAKAVMTALVNSSMQLDSVGRKALYDYDKKAKITDLQCAISAPWSYTVTKTVNYIQKQEFLISDDLIDELLETIKEKIEGDIEQNEVLLNLGLEAVAHLTMDIQSNGYHVKNPIGNHAKSITVSRSSVVTQIYLIEAVDEVNDKLFGGIESTKLSFVLILFIVIRDFYDSLYDLCLIDITYEASEIGIVRDGVLTYCTHTPYGVFSMARDISTAINIPLHEAFGYLQSDNPLSLPDSFTKVQKEKVDAIFESYVEKMTALFHETGDMLSIPKKILIHTDLRSEPLFLKLVEKATKRATRSDSSVLPVSKIILDKYDTEDNELPENADLLDTALLSSAQFFHIKQKYKNLEYL